MAGVMVAQFGSLTIPSHEHVVMFRLEPSRPRFVGLENNSKQEQLDSYEVIC